MLVGVFKPTVDAVPARLQRLGDIHVACQRFHRLSLYKDLDLVDFLPLPYIRWRRSDALLAEPTLPENIIAEVHGEDLVLDGQLRTSVAREAQSDTAPQAPSMSASMAAARWSQSRVLLMEDSRTAIAGLRSRIQRLRHHAANSPEIPAKIAITMAKAVQSAEPETPKTSNKDPSRSVALIFNLFGTNSARQKCR